MSESLADRLLGVINQLQGGATPQQVQDAVVQLADIYTKLNAMKEMPMFEKPEDPKPEEPEKEDEKKEEPEAEEEQ